MSQADPMYNPIVTIQVTDHTGRAIASRPLSGKEVLQLLMDKPRIHRSPKPADKLRLEIALLDRHNKQLRLPLSDRGIRRRIRDALQYLPSASALRQWRQRQSNSSLSDQLHPLPSLKLALAEQENDTHRDNNQ